MLSVLIVKSSSLGDIVHSFPLLSLFFQQEGEFTVDWVAESTAFPLLSRHPFLRKLFLIDTAKWRAAWHAPSTWKEIRKVRRELRKEEYDLLFDLQGNGKSALITSQVRARSKVGWSWHALQEKYGYLSTTHRYTPRGKNVRKQLLSLATQHLKREEVDSLPPLPPLSLSEREREQRDEWIRHPLMHPSRLRIFITAHSGSPNKELRGDIWITFLKKVLLFEEKRGRKVSFFFPWNGERECNQAFFWHRHFPHHSWVLPHLSPSVLQALFREADLVIGVDSFLLHLAGTTQTPTYALFGPSSAGKYAPLQAGGRARHIQGKCPYGVNFTDRCPFLKSCPTAACIKDLSAEELFDSLFFSPTKRENSHGTT